MERGDTGIGEMERKKEDECSKRVEEGEIGENYAPMLTESKNG